MRPSTARGKFEDLKEKLKKRTILIVLIIVIIGVAAASIFFVYSGSDSGSDYSGSESYFERLYLENGNISSGENTRMKVQLNNPTESTTISNLIVEVSTRYSRLDISRPKKSVEEENGKYVIRQDFSEDEGYYPGDTSSEKHFKITGELPPGLNYLVSEIKVRVFADNKEVEEKVLELSISS